MEIISPVTADSCSSYIGKPVCAVLHDGSRYYGFLQAVENEQLILRFQEETAAATSSKKRKNKSDAKTNAFNPYPPYGYFPRGTIALELALIALLFAVPFFW